MYILEQWRSLALIYYDAESGARLYAGTRTWKRVLYGTYKAVMNV